mmetsp:Transcript_64208/g.150737  ORF Transcript_64208/g.150737 Transcript_64208/m.150737 type:complete len:217 (-) Transcript_64208:504-1154(-)
MKYRWLPLPMATFSHPQKWSNSRMQAFVCLQYFVRRSFITKVAVQRRLVSGTSSYPGFCRARSNSSTAEDPRIRAGTFPGSEKQIHAKSRRHRGTPAWKANEVIGRRVAAATSSSVRYSNEATETQHSQKIAGPHILALRPRRSISSAPVRRTSRLPTPASKSIPLFGSKSRESRCAARLAAICWATSRQLRPWKSTTEGSTPLSRRKEITASWLA